MFYVCVCTQIYLCTHTYVYIYNVYSNTYIQYSRDGDGQRERERERIHRVAIATMTDLLRPNQQPIKTSLISAFDVSEVSKIPFFDFGFTLLELLRKNLDKVKWEVSNGNVMEDAIDSQVHAGRCAIETDRDRGSNDDLFIKPCIHDN